MTFVCVLKSGGIYNASHVERLRSFVGDQVLCLTDDPTVEQPVIHLQKAWPGWWAKLELFAIPGEVVYFDLDVTVQSLEWLKSIDFRQFNIMADAYCPGGCLCNSSIMAWTGPRLDLIADFKAEFSHHAGGDQDWIWRHLKGEFCLIEYPHAASFKKHGAAKDAGVIVYHGKIKPWAANSHDLYSLLAPGCKIDESSKYYQAWETVKKAEESSSDRHNAKCWLTYRAIDGRVKFEDWLNCVNTINCVYPETPLGVRWRVSQLTGEAYLMILNGRLEEAWLRMIDVNDIVYSGGSDLWPPCVLNWLRCAVLNQYAMHLEGVNIADSAARVVEIWRGMAHKYDWHQWPVRVDEMLHDIRALNILTAILHERKSTPWLAPKNLVGNKEIFHRCLLKLGEGNPKAVFT